MFTCVLSQMIKDCKNCSLYVSSCHNSSKLILYIECRYLIYASEKLMLNGNSILTTYCIVYLTPFLIYVVYLQIVQMTDLNQRTTKKKEHVESFYSVLGKNWIWSQLFFRNKCKISNRLIFVQSQDSLKVYCWTLFCLTLVTCPTFACSTDCLACGIMYRCCIQVAI